MTSGSRATLVLLMFVSGCSGPPSATTAPPPSSGASVGTPPPSTPPSTTPSTTPPTTTTTATASAAGAAARVELLGEYEACHVTLRSQREARSREHHHLGRLTAELDAARAAVAHARGTALAPARAVLADREEDLREAQQRYETDRVAVRTSEAECNRIQDQIHALPAP